MLAAMTLTQWLEWRAFYDLHHLGEYPDYRADIRSGNAAAAVLNVNRPKGRRQFTIEEAMPKLGDDDKQPMTPEQVRDNVREMIRSRTPRKDRREAQNVNAPVPVVRGTRPQVRRSRQGHRQE